MPLASHGFAVHRIGPSFSRLTTLRRLPRGAARAAWFPAIAVIAAVAATAAPARE